MNEQEKPDRWETISWTSYGKNPNVKTYPDTYRMKVPGGWLVRYLEGEEEGITSSMCFVRDEHHDWNLDL